MLFLNLQKFNMHYSLFFKKLESANDYFISDTVLREGSYGFYIYHKYETTTCGSRNPAIKVHGIFALSYMTC